MLRRTLAFLLVLVAGFCHASHRVKAVIAHDDHGGITLDDTGTCPAGETGQCVICVDGGGTGELSLRHGTDPLISLEDPGGLVGEITAVNGGDAAAAGTSGSAAHADHEHAVATATTGAIQPDDSAAEGTATDLARSDHRHSIVASPPVPVGSANAEGASTAFSRADHVHKATSISGERTQGPDTATTNDGALNSLDVFTMTSGGTAHIRVRVVAREVSANDSAVYVRECRAEDIGGTVSVADVTDVFTSEDIAGWDVTLEASGNTVIIRITGAADTTINWTGTWEVVEL